VMHLRLTTLIASMGYLVIILLLIYSSAVGALSGKPTGWIEGFAYGIAVLFTSAIGLVPLIGPFLFWFVILLWAKAVFLVSNSDAMTLVDTFGLLLSDIYSSSVCRIRWSPCTRGDHSRGRRK